MAQKSLFSGLSGKQRTILNELIKPGVLGNLSLACKNTGIPRRTVYNWKSVNLRFKNRYYLAEEMADDYIVDIAMFGLLKGVLSDSSKAIMFTLRRLRPERYK